ncbi:hypothetical protein FACS1894181_02810 [Bacteroidia bacterium]|nr:hypothetical protein FACS1894181_02810 [Bacteroidia bacterium]
MTILDLIKAACRTKGVPEKHAGRIQKVFKIEKSEGMEASVDAFKENILPAIEEAEKQGNESAAKGAIEEYGKKHNLKEGKPAGNNEPDPVPNPTPGEGLPKELKDLIALQTKQIEELKGIVQNSQKEAQETARIETAKGLLKGANLPEGWINRINPASETSLDDQVKALGEEYTKIKQAAINEAVASGAYSPGSTNFPERSEADWQKLMDSGANGGASPGIVDIGLGK